MRYQLFVFDLDETLWTVHQDTMGPVTGPFRLTDTHEIVGATATIRLRRGVRAVMRHLAAGGKHISLASRSDPEVCRELMELFEIAHFFRYEQYGWQSKGAAVKNILKAFRDYDGIDLVPRDVLFVDDYPANCDSVREIGASSLLFGRDIRSIQELLTILQ